MSTPAQFTTVVLLGAGMFVAGFLANRQPAPVAASASSRQVLYYTCPMHPQYRSNRAGNAPCCGMRLVPEYREGAPSAPGRAAAGAPGTAFVNAGQQRLIGVRTAEVQRSSASQRLRLPGRVAVDATRLYRLIAAADGWIRELGPNPAGNLVRKGEVLASYYTPNLLASVQTYLLAVRTNSGYESGVATIGSQRGPTTLSLQVAVDALRSLGMSDRQIEELKGARTTPSEIQIYAPASGFVLARNVTPGQRFEKGTELYRLADIGRVWVLADVFEKDRRFLRPGALALVHYQGHEFPARMSDALPQLEPQARTLKTRFELDNPGYSLQPDAFVDVELPVEMPAAVTVPADAVVDTGRQKTVYVETSGGSFEPRPVETGWRLGGRVEITRGLEAGERIVVSGNFLIDSESRMRLASAGAAAGRGRDPVCGMAAAAKAKAQYRGQTYSFCSDFCKRTFEANPGAYAKERGTD